MKKLYSKGDQAMNNTYAIIALFNIDGGLTVFNELIGITDNTVDAFRKLEAYDYNKVIRSDYQMAITEVGTTRKEFGMKNGKAFYEEKHKYRYQIDGAEGIGSADVIFSIFEA